MSPKMTLRSVQSDPEQPPAPYEEHAEEQTLRCGKWFARVHVLWHHTEWYWEDRIAVSTDPERLGLEHSLDYEDARSLMLTIRSALYTVHTGFPAGAPSYAKWDFHPEDHGVEYVEEASQEGAS